MSSSRASPQISPQDFAFLHYWQEVADNSTKERKMQPRSASSEVRDLYRCRWSFLIYLHRARKSLSRQRPESSPRHFAGPHFSISKLRAPLATTRSDVGSQSVRDLILAGSRHSAREQLGNNKRSLQFSSVTSRATTSLQVLEVPSTIEFDSFRAHHLNPLQAQYFRGV
jgi:hypothetical protein